MRKEEVEAIALLARLELDEAEVAAMQVDLTAILAHMDALAEVDTAGVEPMTHAVPMDLPLREDVIAPSLPIEVATAGAPEADDGAFLVPHVLERAR